MPEAFPDDPRSDQELIASLNRGNDAAFDALYYRYRDWVVRLAHRFTSNADDALDVMQETFAYLAGKFPGFELTCAITSFLYPVVRNLSIAARRKSGRFVGDEPAMLNLAARAEPSSESQSRQDLLGAMASLTDLHREVILMRFVDDLSLQEIADALDVPLGTVKSRLHHAIDALRQDSRAREFFEA
jgi:RNA polymerase sigma-70 factor (ECF subfamily)